MKPLKNFHRTSSILLLDFSPCNEIFSLFCIQLWLIYALNLLKDKWGWLLNRSETNYFLLVTTLIDWVNEGVTPELIVAVVVDTSDSCCRLQSRLWNSSCVRCTPYARRQDVSETGLKSFRFLSSAATVWRMAIQRDFVFVCNFDSPLKGDRQSQGKVVIWSSSFRTNCIYTERWEKKGRDETLCKSSEEILHSHWQVTSSPSG